MGWSEALQIVVYLARTPSCIFHFQYYLKTFNFCAIILGFCCPTIHNSVEVLIRNTTYFTRSILSTYGFIQFPYVVYYVLRIYQLENWQKGYLFVIYFYSPVQIPFNSFVSVFRITLRRHGLPAGALYRKHAEELALGRKQYRFLDHEKASRCCDLVSVLLYW